MHCEGVRLPPPCRVQPQIVSLYLHVILSEEAPGLSPFRKENKPSKLCLMFLVCFRNYLNYVVEELKDPYRYDVISVYETYT
jgi:hypothetical protein